MLTWFQRAVLEDIESLLPSSQTKKLAEQAPPIDAQTASTHRSTGTKGRAKGKRQVEEKPFVKPDEPEDSGAKALFSIDAFSLGNVSCAPPDPRSQCLLSWLTPRSRTYSGRVSATTSARTGMSAFDRSTSTKRTSHAPSLCTLRGATFR